MKLSPNPEHNNFLDHCTSFHSDRAERNGQHENANLEEIDAVDASKNGTLGGRSILD